MPFKFNYRYYPHILFKKNVNPQSKLILADELLLELQKFMTIYYKNFFYL